MHKLSQREQDVLKILIADYIASAIPVGSRTISKKYPAHLSPATIRNIMADLTSMGLLAQPHTSAGRLPTSSGMRYYVDSLLKKRELTEKEMEAIRDKCGGNERGVSQVLMRATKVLSSVSKYAGLVLTPSQSKVVFKQLEFVPLSSKRLLGILVTRDGGVQNRLIDISEEMSFAEIERVANYCNRFFSGLTLEEALKKVRKELERDEAEYDRLLKKAMAYSKQMLDDLPDSELVVDGETMLLSAPEFAEAEKFRELVAALEEKGRIAHLLERCYEGDGVRIFIGADADVCGVHSAGIVGAPYVSDGRVVGAIGVIGPMRMDYSTVVPVVDFMAKVIGDVLET